MRRSRDIGMHNLAKCPKTTASLSKTSAISMVLHQHGFRPNSGGSNDKSLLPPLMESSFVLARRECFGAAGESWIVHGVQPGRLS